MRLRVGTHSTIGLCWSDQASPLRFSAPLCSLRLNRSFLSSRDTPCSSAWLAKKIKHPAQLGWPGVGELCCRELERVAVEVLAFHEVGSFLDVWRLHVGAVPFHLAVFADLKRDAAKKDDLGEVRSVVEV